MFAFLVKVIQIIANTYKLGVIINTNENRNNSENAYILINKNLLILKKQKQNTSQKNKNKKTKKHNNPKTADLSTFEGVKSFRGDREDIIVQRGEGGPCDVRLRLGLFIVPSSAPKEKNGLTSCYLALSS